MGSSPEETVQKFLQAISELQSSVQNIQSSQQTGGSLAADTKSLGYNKEIDDTGTDEAHKGKTFNDAEMWTINKKLLVEREQGDVRKSGDYDRSLKEIELKTAQIELARKEHDFATKQHMDALQFRVAEHAELAKHIFNMHSLGVKVPVSE